MKKIAMLFVAGYLFQACSGSGEVEVGQQTTIEVNKVFDAGEVIKGEVINAKFEITNTGSYPLVIAEVKGSCSCTVTDFPGDPLQPGESGEIMAHVNTDKTGTGAISKAVRIVANTTPSVNQVIVKATVKNR